LLARVTIPFQTVAFAFVLLGVIRPLAAAPFAVAFGMDRIQTALVSWFGIRGIGSLYYLFYAVGHGIPDNLSEPLINIVLCSIALSIVVHGVTVTPFMERYQQQRGHLRSTTQDADCARSGKMIR
jgi:NhaP-type Na+/H+ or K+/H+ antiporter